jgi:hypothetical protein
MFQSSGRYGTVQREQIEEVRPGLTSLAHSHHQLLSCQVPYPCSRVLVGSVPDPGSGAFLTPGSGSGMNILDYISESLETVLDFKILKFFDADADADPASGNFLTLDPGSGTGMEKIRIRDPGLRSRIRNTAGRYRYGTV